MFKLFSYVVDHDYGFAPNASGSYCTLVHCKFNASGKRRNIVELAQVGNWILGTGGQSPSSAGNGNIVYFMRIDEKLPFVKFLADPRFSGRTDQRDFGAGNTFALISKHFFYFGENAFPISSLPDLLRTMPLEKKGPRYRADLPPEKVQALISWFERHVKRGIHGRPCDPIAPELPTSLTTHERSPCGCCPISRSREPSASCSC